jgi:hypothetical protein
MRGSYSRRGTATNKAPKVPEIYPILSPSLFGKPKGGMTPTSSPVINGLSRTTWGGEVKWAFRVNGPIRHVGHSKSISFLRIAVSLHLHHSYSPPAAGFLIFYLHA